MQVLVLARLPHRLKAKHPRLLENLLELAEARQIEPLNAIITMLSDFYQHGTKSRYVEKFQGLPIWELKTASRGGLKGGARVYFFFTQENEAVLVNAEVKAGDSPSQTKLKEVLQVYRAVEEGLPVLERSKKNGQQKN